MATEKEQLSKPKQLVVEGKSAERLFSALLSALGITEIEIHDFGGTTELRGFLKAFKRTPGFDPGVNSLGIVRDADNDPKAAFQSVRDALSNAELPGPEKPDEPVVVEGFRVAIMVLPDSGTKGTLETVCLSSVVDDPAMECVDRYLECLSSSKLTKLPGNLDKARVQTFLASRSRPGLLLGEAAAKGHWPWDHSAFEQVRAFIQSL